MNEINNSDNLDYSAPPRSFIEAIKVCLEKYAEFKGRASRSEFWWFYLAHSFCSAVLTIGTGLVQTILALAIFVPYCAVGVRRFHDTNRSGAGFIGLLAAILFSGFLFGTGFGGEDVVFFLVLVMANCLIALICFCAIRGKKEKNEYNLPTDLGRETTS